MQVVTAELARATLTLHRHLSALSAWLLHAGCADAASLAMTLKGLEALLQGAIPVKFFVKVLPLSPPAFEEAVHVNLSLLLLMATCSLYWVTNNDVSASHSEMTHKFMHIVVQPQVF